MVRVREGRSAWRPALLSLLVAPRWLLRLLVHSRVIRFIINFIREVKNLHTFDLLLLLLTLLLAFHDRSSIVRIRWLQIELDRLALLISSLILLWIATKRVILIIILCVVDHAHPVVLTTVILLWTLIVVMTVWHALALTSRLHHHVVEIHRLSWTLPIILTLWVDRVSYILATTT